MVLTRPDAATEDVRPSSGRDRPDRGHASSNDAGGDTSGSGAVVAGGNIPAAAGSDDPAAARSRSFRKDDENRRLRRRFGGAGVSENEDGSDTPAAAPVFVAACSRVNISVCQGGGDGAEDVTAGSALEPPAL